MQKGLVFVGLAVWLSTVLVDDVHSLRIVRSYQRRIRPCGPICMMYCPFGNVKDSNGCPICRCKPDPSGPNPPQCLQKRVCEKLCLNGFMKDRNGCDTCDCKPVVGPPKRPICPLFMCRMYCPNGFATGSDGCQTCRCKPNVPPKPDCGPMCKMHCANGFQTGPDGCPICKCKPGRVTVPPKPKPVCGPICRMYCPNGFVKDSEGCPVCRCKPSSPTGRCGSRACFRHCLRGDRPPTGCTCRCPNFSLRGRRLPVSDTLSRSTP